MKKKEKIEDFLTQIGHKLDKSDIRNFIRHEPNAVQLVDDEETNRIGYVLLLNNEVSNIIIWYELEEDSSYFQMGTTTLSSGPLTINYLLTQAEGDEEEYISESNLEITDSNDGFAFITA